MSTTPLEMAAGFHAGVTGPVTRRHQRRSYLVYGLLVLTGLLPSMLGASAGWQAFGLGLLVPGGGLHVLGVGGSVGALGVLALFWFSIIVWFWCGMVLAPVAVWLGSAVLAGSLAEAPVGPAPAGLACATVVLIALRFVRAARQRQHADSKTFAARQQYIVESVAEVRAQCARPHAADRVLDDMQLSGVRYLLDRALQPIGEFTGYTVIDQFQPAALRYQINHLGYALGMVQAHYTPNFHGYLAEAQRRLIDTYRVRKVWDYWVLESMWGHLNFTHFDPAARDNIMLTGYYGMQVNQYMLNTGDRRYTAPGSLSFRLNAHTVYPHDAHSIVDSVRDNHARAEFCLYPCEPNWIYAVCNMYGMGALASHDAVFGTRYLPEILPRWQQRLDTEFTDGKGSLVPLRSLWTGFGIPFYAGEAGFAFFANVFSPDLGARLWAVARRELGYCIAPDADGEPRLSIPPSALTRLETIDPGNYRRGALFGYAAVAMSAREFGDDALADAAIRAMDQDCGRVVEGGVARYTGGSGWANVWAVNARLMRTGDFRRSFVDGPAAGALEGPLLDEAPYPAVLVAEARSSGRDLKLVLCPGHGPCEANLGFARLCPGQRYRSATESGSLEFVADSSGKSTLRLRLAGRMVLHFLPV